MRKMDTWLASLLWVAVATLLPLTALEPVVAERPKTTLAAYEAACADGSPHLPMDCSAATL